MLYNFIITTGCIGGLFTPLFSALTGKKSKSKNEENEVKKIYSPVNGVVMPITQSADVAHQQETLGKGVCFIPEGGKIFAPVDGVVDLVFTTKHAINIISDDGVEILIHCGIDTVNLKGEGFITHVKDGDKFQKGALLLEYDEKLIKKSGYSVETQLVVCNSSSYSQVTPAANGQVQIGDVVLRVE
ncbi:MAG: PTS glucose transporter subunit IIA [Spirochaetaceae bacterium]|jgi:glucose-specific phosphotransferase system IIA component|nr:PTS glucose transporter subunit IIA [Spirochaetaceae bacterium]